MTVKPIASVPANPAPSNAIPSTIAPPRIIQRSGTRDILTVGRKKHLLGDSYHQLLTISWPRLFLLIIGFYVAINSLFAIGYYLDPDGVLNARPGSFADAFFFSVQTLATIGYGYMAPKSSISHVMVTIEAFAGVLMTALATGLMFAKFSRPTARVIFSDVAVIAPRDGVPTLMFRVANERANQIVEARMQVAIARTERTREGEVMRRFHDLPLSRQQNIIFALTWTVMHPIDERSPLHGTTLEDLAKDEAEIIVSLTGIDETMSQTVHARYSYLPSELRWFHRFVDIVGRTEQGKRFIDYTKFHDTHALPTSGVVPATPGPG
jgi:inward rectifier potassium channel